MPVKKNHQKVCPLKYKVKKIVSKNLSPKSVSVKIYGQKVCPSKYKDKKCWHTILNDYYFFGIAGDVEISGYFIAGITRGFGIYNFGASGNGREILGNDQSAVNMGLENIILGRLEMGEDEMPIYSKYHL